MAAARERRVPKRYSDEVFSRGGGGGFIQKKIRTKTNDRKLYPVVVTAVDKVIKRVKIHYVGIFGIFEILFCDTCSFSLCLRVFMY